MNKIIVANINSDVRDRPAIDAEKNQIAEFQLAPVYLSSDFKLFFCGARQIGFVEFLKHLAGELTAIDTLFIARPTLIGCAQIRLDDTSQIDQVGGGDSLADIIITFSGFILRNIVIFAARRFGLAGLIAGIRLTAGQ